MNIAFNHLLYPANLLSLLRVILSIPICWLIARPDLDQDPLLLALISIAVLSDVFDGFVSRKLHQESELGRIIDPIADKIVIVTGIVSAVLFRGFPALVVLWQIYRDVVIITLGIPMSRRSGEVVASNIWGKMNTLFIAFLCLSFIASPEFITTEILSYMVMATLWISSIIYYIRAEPYLVSGAAAKYLLRFSLFATAGVLWLVAEKLAPGLNWP
jgi:cardiolipin synthase (CMP-forming)